MQAAVATFNFNGQSLNCIVDEAGNPLFRADDVCEILEFANARDALANHVDDDDVAKRDTIDSLGRTQIANHVNESGLYSLIFASSLCGPANPAKNFLQQVPNRNRNLKEHHDQNYCQHA
jgi:prophage antirepressor-like protein